MKAYKNRYFIASGISFIMLFGCVGPGFLDDELHNKYFEHERLTNPPSEYVGEWTSANAGGIYTVKIYPDGWVNACSKELPKTNTGKLIKLDSDIAIIYERGTIERISTITPDQMVAAIYNQPAKYHLNDTPTECRPIFDNFSPQ